MASAMREIKDALAMFRGFWPTRQGGKLYRRAVTLHENGRLDEAFLAGQDALELLRRPSVARTSPPALTLILSATALLADLAPQLGKETVARTAINEALAACRAAIDEQPRMGEWQHLKTHMASFEQRLGRERL